MAAGSSGAEINPGRQLPQCGCRRCPFSPACRQLQSTCLRSNLCAGPGEGRMPHSASRAVWGVAQGSSCPEHGWPCSHQVCVAGHGTPLLGGCGPSCLLKLHAFHCLYHPCAASSIIAWLLMRLSCWKNLSLTLAPSQCTGSCGTGPHWLGGPSWSLPAQLAARPW